MDNAIQRDWIAERDRQLAQWFAEGHSDEAVLKLADDKGYDLSLQGVQDMRASLRGETVEVLASDGGKLLAKIARTHKTVRVQELAELCDRLRRGEQWCEDKGRWPTLPKLAEPHMKALRQIAEETNDIEPAAHGLEEILVRVRRVPPDKRRQFMVLLSEARSLIDSDLELGDADPLKALPVVDVEAQNREG